MNILNACEMKAKLKIETFTVKFCIANITSGDQDKKKFCNIYKIANSENFNPQEGPIRGAF